MAMPVSKRVSRASRSSRVGSGAASCSLYPLSASLRVVTHMGSCSPSQFFSRKRNSFIQTYRYLFAPRLSNWPVRMDAMG